jgi:hypothetical protein
MVISYFVGIPSLLCSILKLHILETDKVRLLLPSLIFIIS